MNTPDRKMYKIVCPMERNGRKWWMNVGKGFTNRDASINLHLDALPLGQMNLVLQLREYTEEEMRENAERRANWTSNRPGYAHTTARHAPSPDATKSPLATAEMDFHPGSEPLVPQSLPF